MIRKNQGEKDNGPIFYPNYKYIKRTFKSHVGLVDPDTYEIPRDKVYKVPACQIKEGQTCNYKIRKAIKESMQPLAMAPIQELSVHHAANGNENGEKDNLMS